ncbi:MAG: GH36-type glycosyl hydrolase domain-containing protein [Terracidiphilus sp.]
MSSVLPLIVFGIVPSCALAARPDGAGKARDAELAKAIRSNENMRQVHQMARDLLKGGFDAGSYYHAVWIRDMNTFIEAALEVNPPARVRAALLPFFKFQGADGNIIDGYAPLVRARVSRTTRLTPLAPELMGFKNTVEVDQESSLVQAVYKYVSATGDRSILDERIGGKTVRERLGLALDYLLNNRYDPAYGLIWSATRADWGDVQPETNPGVLFGPQSHKAICIYDNAMFLMGVDDYIRLLGPDTPEDAHWRNVSRRIRRNIRKYLWDKRKQKFYPHIYLDGSPFPKSFDENAIYYFGGTAVAIEAGALTRKEVRESLRQMDADVKAAHASSVGLTLYPAYPRGFFKNPGMGPYIYQNGGDWTWFGGRVVRGLIEQGYDADAYRELQPMVDRVKREGGFYEWWTRDDQPRGSANFHGSAGELGKDIELLEAWAAQH